MITLYNKRFEVFISREAIRQRVEELGRLITQDYEGKDLHIVCVLNGSFMFAADLARSIELEVPFSFIKVSSYAGTMSTGEVDEIIGLADEGVLEGKDLLLIEDIVDTGNTLLHLQNQLEAYSIRSLQTCSLLFKPAAFKFDFKIKYVGFEIPNDFVVGYGLDYDELGRNYADIYKPVEE